MGLVFVQRYAPPSAFIAGGTQYIDGQLTISGSTTVVLSSDIYSATGDYILFDYTNGTFPGGQSALGSLVFNDSALLLSGVQAVTDDPINKRVVLSLASRATNGTQYVEGVLDISGSLSIFLNATLYATAGTYTLFDWTGTGSFPTPAQVSNITCYPLKSGLSVVGAPYVDGSTIKVQLA